MVKRESGLHGPGGSVIVCLCALMRCHSILRPRLPALPHARTGLPILTLRSKLRMPYLDRLGMERIRVAPVIGYDALQEVGGRGIRGAVNLPGARKGGDVEGGDANQW
ncbi:hypothetical protein JB92DRAFT_2832628 [Gautieria morchelliformis]|nr:hypothetical protein JB92DRAFT_2832628 [Gautieria morchelliformis]